MKIAIVYDSSTGTTERAAEAMGAHLSALGHDCHVQSLRQADPADLAQADLIGVGSWVKGWFVIRQHPTARTLQFIDKFGNLDGQQVFVFCTYKIAIGSTLKVMAAKLTGKGAQVVGKFSYRGAEPTQSFKDFAAKLG